MRGIPPSKFQGKKSIAELGASGTYRPILLGTHRASVPTI